MSVNCITTYWTIWNKRRLRWIIISMEIRIIFDSMEKSRSKIRNIRQYWFVALFNAPATMHSYYEAEVRHDYDFPKRR